MDRYIILNGTNWRGDPLFYVYDAEARIMIKYFHSQPEAADFIAHQLDKELI